MGGKSSKPEEAPAAASPAAVAADAAALPAPEGVIRADSGFVDSPVQPATDSSSSSTSSSAPPATTSVQRKPSKKEARAARAAEKRASKEAEKQKRAKRKASKKKRTKGQAKARIAPANFSQAPADYTEDGADSTADSSTAPPAEDTQPPPMPVADSAIELTFDETAPNDDEKGAAAAANPTDTATTAASAEAPAPAAPPAAAAAAAPQAGIPRKMSKKERKQSKREAKDALRAAKQQAKAAKRGGLGRKKSKKGNAPSKAGITLSPPTTNVGSTHSASSLTLEEVEEVETIRQTDHGQHFSRFELQSLYHQYKSNGKSISRDDFHIVYLSLTRSGDDSLFGPVFDLFDVNKDGKFEFGELITFLGVVIKGDAKQKAQYCFQLYDRENTGYITKQGLTELLTKLPVRKMIQNQIDASAVLHGVRNPNDSLTTLDEVDEADEAVAELEELQAEVQKRILAKEVERESREKLLNSSKGNKAQTRALLREQARNRAQAKVVVEQIFKEIRHEDSTGITLEEFLNSVEQAPSLQAFFPF